MIYLIVVFGGVGLVLLFGTLYGALVRDIYPLRFRANCQGRSWRRAFPHASNASIREFLQVFIKAFDFPASKRLAFGPDDSVFDIYQELYPSRWIPDAMELEIFASELDALYGVGLACMWSKRLTLGEIFSAIQVAAQPNAPANGLRSPLS